MLHSSKKVFTYLGNIAALSSVIASVSLAALSSLAHTGNQQTPKIQQKDKSHKEIPLTIARSKDIHKENVPSSHILPRFQGVLAAQYIQAQHSAKCLHIAGGNFNNGTQLSQWDCLPQNNVRWEISSVGNGFYQIKSKQTNKCIYVDGSSSQNGAKVVQWDCINQTNGQWKIVRNNDGYSHIVNAQSGKCLHVHGGGNENNAAITQWDCIQQGNVKWKLTNNPEANSPVSESMPQPTPQAQRYRVKMWFTITNANDGAFDNTIESYGDLRIDGELYWQIPRIEADNNQREAGQSLEVSDSTYTRKEFVFNKPTINYEIFLRDADGGSPDDDVYQGNRRNFNLEFLAGKGEQIFQFKNERTFESSYLRIIVDRLP